MGFYFRGYDYTKGRGTFRCYLIVETDSIDHMVAQMMLASPRNHDSTRLKPVNGQAPQVLRRNKFPTDGSFTVYAYHTPAIHEVRIKRQRRVYRELNALIRQHRELVVPSRRHHPTRRCHA